MKVQVIEKKKGRINRMTGEEIKGNLRVCAYARVSTEKEEQINSYNSQLKYYEEKIKSNGNWKYVGIYADEGITGTLDYKRDGFMKMMQDATQNKFDMIITKSISRFGRNTVDTLKYVRLLKEKGIAIYFEEERINTLEISRGMLLGAISKRYDEIVEFTAFEDFISFERKGKNKVKRVENNKIEVTIEVDMVCGVVK